ncbi:MAG: EAL domain-containing protein [Bdellovibrionaceae bacterium]|nr:EAL domain-containing protein [Pseudobdellovibrionaceae bacterium]
MQQSNILFRDFKAGDVIFRQGEDGNCAYIIEEGRVQISLEKNGDSFPVSIMGVGEIFGEMAILDGLPRAGTARCMEDTRLCVVSSDQLYNRIHQSDSVVRLLVLLLIKRTRSMNAKLVSSLQSAGSDTGSDEGGQPGEGKSAINEVRFEIELHKAFQEREFRLHYQPIVDMKNSEILGFEALIRWNSPTLGPMRPDLFMKVAEESSLIVPLGRWIQETAIADLKKIEAATGRSFFMSVNVSGRQFMDPAYLKNLEEIRQRYGATTEQLKLEITERIFIDGARAIEMVEQCRQLGYGISLDDFGTGYSSLSYLKNLKVSNLKIDQSFTRGANSDPRSHALVKCMVQLCKDMRIESVAEGIETEEMAKAMREMGCQYAQGYLYARPQALDDLLKFLGAGSQQSAA